jgi:hypothetical protein
MPVKQVALDSGCTLHGIDSDGKGFLPQATGRPRGAADTRLECGRLAVGLLVVRGNRCEKWDLISEFAAISFGMLAGLFAASGPLAWAKGKNLYGIVSFLRGNITRRTGGDFERS